MENELALSLNIKLSDEVFRRIAHAQNRLGERFADLRIYDRSPHLSALLKFADPAMARSFADKLTEEFRDEECWNLEFANCSVSKSGEYIFLDLSEESLKKVSEIHERALSVTRNIGTEGQGGTSAKYAFLPHISIIKLLPEESAEAFRLLGDELNGLSFQVSSYTITVDDEENKGGFRILGELELKTKTA